MFPQFPDIAPDVYLANFFRDGRLLKGSVGLVNTIGDNCISQKFHDVYPHKF
jgi:hypothetical protein